MSVCTTSTAPDSFQTNTISATGSSLILTTAADQVITTSTASVATACAIPLPCFTGVCFTPSPPCVTTTVFFPVTSTIPGNVNTITSFFTNFAFETVTNRGAVVTSCRATPPPVVNTTPANTPPSPTPTAIAPTPTTPPANTPTTPPTSPTAIVTASTPLVITPDTTDSVMTVTQFSTYLLTTRDAAGQMTTQTSVDAFPTTLQDRTGANSSSSNTGSIVGGVIGGLAGLLALFVLFWFLRRRGYWGKRAEEPLYNDEMWMPAPHSPIEPDIGGGAGGGAIGAGLMSERRRSYGPSLGHSTGGDFGSQEGGYDSARGASPIDGEGYPAGAYGGGQRVAHRQSLQSGSGHSHDAGSYGSHNDNRLVPQEYYQPMSSGPGLLPIAYGSYDDGHREEVVEQTRSSHSHSSLSHSDNATNAATTGSTNGNDTISRPSHSLRRPAIESLPHFNSSGTTSTSTYSVSSGQPSAASTAPSSPGSFEPVKFVEPALKRMTSNDSLQAPSQFLGARIVNVTPRIEHGGFNFPISPTA